MGSSQLEFYQQQINIVLKWQTEENKYHRWTFFKVTSLQ